MTLSATEAARIVRLASHWPRSRRVLDSRPERRAAHEGEAPGHTFADARKEPKATADQYISLINHASIAALARTIGAPVDPLRFRANVYLECLPAWAEHEWLGREITIGAARPRVVSAITRCPATQVNPPWASATSTLWAHYDAPWATI
jgi:uncharacterized protein YcbX